ncbi:hypothetical protein L0Z72_12815 [candidate division KSB1 bacterium]|nr:hypothetical protein [candidate division KSB1 bacterium]
MTQFDRTQIRTLPLSKRNSKSAIEKIAVDPDMVPAPIAGHEEIIDKIAASILQAKQNNASIILAFGAHVIKNGLGLVLRRMIEQGFVTHLATNGAGSIHDWEFAFHGKSEEDVRANVQQGQFGIWEETGKYINLALLVGASQGKGYGESIAELIHTDKIVIPALEEINSQILKMQNHGNLQTNQFGGLVDLLLAMNSHFGREQMNPGEIHIGHPFKNYSFQEAAYSVTIPITIHPGFGYDIIYTSPYNFGVAIGRTAEVDWLRFANSVARLEGGVYISIGSAIMSPMIFEKALSMTRNAAKQAGNEIQDFMVVVNDIQPAGDWQWGTGMEPPKDSPAYYLRFCKTFDRMGAREMHYISLDNRAFLVNLYQHLKTRN